jgi:hypothetical protein
MPTALQYLTLLKRDRKLRRKQEDKRQKNFSRPTLTLSPGTTNTARDNLNVSAACAVDSRAVGI